MNPGLDTATSAAQARLDALRAEVRRLLDA